MNDFLHSRPRRYLLVVIVVVAAVLIAVCAVVVVAGGGQDPASPDAGPGPIPASTQAVSPSRTPVADEEPLRLIPGKVRVSGVSLGYPYSVTGAVSAAVEFWSQAGSTLDPDRAAAIGRVIADESWTTAPEDFAAGAARSRQRLGLPAAGDIGLDASMALEANEFQLRDVTASRVTVLLLGYLTTTTTRNGSRTQVSVFPAYMHWSGLDWKIEKGSDTDYSSLGAQPGTSAAVAAGWRELSR